MRLAVALFVMAGLAAAAATLAPAVLSGRLGVNEPALRTIHYDRNVDLSSQRRLPPK